MTSASATPAASPEGHELVTVVVATLGREPRLRETVEAVLGQSHARLELVVVDNDPLSGRVRGLLDDVLDPRLRIVEQPVRGLSAARNEGLAAARGGLVAYTDDDAVPDPTWLEGLLAVIADDTRGVVSCVTGRVVAAETDTQEQAWFEELGVFDKGLRRTVWSRHDDVDPALGTPGVRSVFFPYTAGEMGSGNNMLFRVEALRRLGGFDELLGAGSATRGGEDLDAYRRVVLAGDVLVYTPDAVVRHHHRVDYPALRSQMFGYGLGMAAGLTKVLLGGRDQTLGVLRCLPRGVWTLLAPGSTKNVKNPDGMPSELIRTELLGFAVGPFVYLRSRLRAGLRRATGRSTSGRGR